MIDALIDAILSANQEEFAYKGQKNSGRRAYNPVTMIKLFIYGYLNSIKTSRKLERECHRNIEVIWLIGNLKPDHKSIADYRKDNAAAIKYLPQSSQSEGTKVHQGKLIDKREAK